MKQISLSFRSINPIRPASRYIWLVVAIVLLPGTRLTAALEVDADGTLHLPAYVLPQSSLLDDETRAALNRYRGSEDGIAAADKAALSASSPVEFTDRATMAELRKKSRAEAYYRTPFYRRVCDQYPVVMTTQEIGGVHTEVFMPKEGIPPGNQDRVLINLHGGNFDFGARYISHLESMPIAFIGKIKVISIDYRMAPEYTFPAASEDVVAVYRELLKSYKPSNIGLYGSSAGAVLTAQSIAQFEAEELPLPGAVGMLCGAASYICEGDSGAFLSGLVGAPLEMKKATPYFKGTDKANPLAFPIRSSQILAKFPPSLLITATRDGALSSVVNTHSHLCQLGVEAELHVWEGLGHTFYIDNPELQQSREVHDVVVRFFSRHLGK